MSEKPTPEQALAELKEQIRSVLLSTLGEDGNPHTGYTPFIFDGRDLIIFVSQLSLHTRDLLANAKASAMLIADESTSSQIFARTRVSYQCNAVVIAPHEEHYAILLEAMQARHGKIMDLLKGLPDFVLFRLQPSAGQFVMGFGQAFHLHGDNFDEFEHATSA